MSNLNVTMKPKVRNEYVWELKKADGTVKTYTGHNAVLNNYYSYIIANNAAPNLTHLSVGSGTTPVDLTQTALANRRATYAATVSNNSNVYPVERTLTVVLEEGVLTGSITEVGLTTGNITTVYTRSLITDSEDNPIEIIKEANDILTITVKVYYEFDSDSLPSYATWLDSVGAAINLRNGAAILPTTIRYYTTRLSESALNVFEGNRLLKASLIAGLTQTTNSGTLVKDTVNGVLQLTGAKMLANDYNGIMSRPEWMCRVIGNSYFVLDIASSGLFTPFIHEGLQLGVGDGETAGFNIPLCYFDEDDVLQILVDGVAVDPSEYVLNAHNAEVSMRQLPSADFTKLYDYEYSGDNAICVGYPFSSVTAFTTARWESFTESTLYYDFGQPVNVSHMFYKTLPRYTDVGYRYIGFDQVSLKAYNEVTEEWEEVYNRTTNNDDFNFETTLVKYALPSPVTASKFALKARIANGGGNMVHTVPDPPLGFGLDQKSVVFLEPPAAGAVITANVRSKAPIKNANFNLQVAIQAQYTKG